MTDIPDNNPEIEMDLPDESELPVGIILFKGKHILDSNIFLKCLKEEWDINAEKVPQDQVEPIINKFIENPSTDGGSSLFSIGDQYLYCIYFEQQLDLNLKEVVEVLNPEWVEGPERIQEHESYITLHLFNKNDDSDDNCDNDYNKSNNDSDDDSNNDSDDDSDDDSEYSSDLENYILFTKLVSSWLSLDDALAYFYETIILPPEAYRKQALVLKKDQLPFLLWINIFVDPGTEVDETTPEENASWHLLTMGMEHFGKPDFEIINSKKPVQDLYNFICDMIVYTLEQDVLFGDNDMVGVSENEQYHVTLEMDEGIETVRIHI